MLIIGGQRSRRPAISSHQRRWSLSGGSSRLLFASASLGTKPQVSLCRFAFLSLLRPYNPRADEPPSPLYWALLPRPLEPSQCPHPLAANSSHICFILISFDQIV